MFRLLIEEDSYCCSLSRVGRSDESMSDMIAQITQWRLACEKLPENAKEFCTQHFARAMAVDYVHHSNVGEMVGTQSWQETQEVIKKLCEDRHNSICGVQKATRCDKETMNTYEAVNLLHNTHEAMGNTGLLTVQEICDIHKVLLRGLHPDCGKIRTRDAYTHWHGGLHYYPPPKQAEELFYAIIDHHNNRMAECQLNSTTNEYTEYIFKCAANLLFEFVSVHPFGDGNGRTCRLLANYVLGLITPFPVSLSHSPGRNAREDYLNAIVHCREHPEEGLQELTAMLIKGAWQGWKSLFNNLRRRHQLEPGVTIGPIVVKKSACGKEYVTKRVGRIWAGALPRGVKADMEGVVESIVCATLKTDISHLSGSQYIQKTVSVTENVSVILDIYGP